MKIILACQNTLRCSALAFILRRRGHNVIEVTNLNGIVQACTYQADIIIIDLGIIPGLEGLKPISRPAPPKRPPELFIVSTDEETTINAQTLGAKILGEPLCIRDLSQKLRL